MTRLNPKWGRYAPGEYRTQTAAGRAVVARVGRLWWWRVWRPVYLGGGFVGDFASTLTAAKAAAAAKLNGTAAGAMATPRETPYTPEMLAEFDHITSRACSPDQVKRIEGRMAVSRFVAQHGKDACDAMFAELKKRDARRGTKPGKRGPGAAGGGGE